MTGIREATAASTAWDRAQSRSRDSIAARAPAKTGPGIGMVQPVRCASTESSAHKVIRGSLIAARWAARTCRSVHGDDRHCGPQVGLREVISGAGDPVGAGFGDLAAGAVGHPG
jgi:hypothetical protein